MQESLRQRTMRELEEWHERRDKTRERQMAKLREKNLTKIRGYRKKLLAMPYARFRVKKLRYLDKMEAYVERWAWLPWSYRNMLGVWFERGDSRNLEMYDEYLPLN